MVEQKVVEELTMFEVELVLELGTSVTAGIYTMADDWQGLPREKELNPTVIGGGIWPIKIIRVGGAYYRIVSEVPADSQPLPVHDPTHIPAFKYIILVTGGHGWTICGVPLMDIRF